MARRSALDIESELEDIDRGIFAIRFNQHLSAMEKIALIDREFEKRNETYAELQQQRAIEFREFVESLSLKDANIEPFFQIPTRCRLILNGERSQKVLKSPKMGPMGRMAHKMKKSKQNSLDALMEQIIFEQSEKDSLKKKDLREKINDLTKHPKILSFNQQAHLQAMNFELDIIRELQKGSFE